MGSVIDILRRSLNLVYDDHVGRLLAISQPHLKSINPNKRLPLQEMLKQYNSDVGTEIIRYGNQLEAEVVGVIEKVKDNPEAPPVEVVMEVIDEFVQPDLYKKRFDIYVQSIERRMRGFGIKLNLDEHRIDIPKSLSFVGADNNCRRIQSGIANAIDKLYLTRTSLENSSVESISIYAKINRLYDEHPVLFWVVGLVLSLGLGALAL